MQMDLLLDSAFIMGLLLGRGRMWRGVRRGLWRKSAGDNWEERFGGGRKNKRRKIKKDVARMQECAQVRGGVDTRYLRRSYCSCSYVSSPTFLHLASANIVTFSDNLDKFQECIQNVVSALP